MVVYNYNGPRKSVRQLRRVHVHIFREPAACALRNLCGSTSCWHESRTNGKTRKRSQIKWVLFLKLNHEIYHVHTYFR